MWTVSRHARTVTRLVAVPLLLLTTACASPWQLTPVAPEHWATDPRGHLPHVPDHEAVQDVALRIGSHELVFVVHFAQREDGAVLRAHLGSESGLTGLDLTVRGTRHEVHVQSALTDFPGFAGLVAADVARVWGARSIHAAGLDRAPLAAVEATKLAALELMDGSWVVFEHADVVAHADALRVTLLGLDARPEAVVVYADHDDEGIPRTVTLEDLRDGHVLEMELVQVWPTGEAGP